MTSIRLRSLVSLTALFAPTILLAQGGAVAPDPWAVLALPRTHTPTPTTAAITAADLMTRLYAFSDDSMGGRQIGSKGNYQGVEYIASEIKKFGLQPAGDNGTYFQKVPVSIVRRSFDSDAPITVGGTPLKPWVDFVPRDFGAPLRSLDGVQVIYGGVWGDSTSLIPAQMAAGKFVVLKSIVTIPGNPPGIPSRLDVFRYFIGSAGIAVVGLEGFSAASIAAFHASPSNFAPVDPNAASEAQPNIPIYMYVTNPTATLLLGAPLETLHPGAAGQTLRGTPHFTETRTATAYPARNVVGIIPGSDPKLRGEYVAIGGHNDHIGMTSSAVLMSDLGQPVAHDSEYVVNHLFRESGADDGAPTLTAEQQQQVNGILAKIRAKTGGKSARIDTVFNGADDDGSGSVSVLEMAQFFAAQKVKPKRSLLFVWHVGEEAGLYGSAYFTDHPTVPRDSIVAQLNIDMVGRGDAMDVTGMKKGGDEKIHGNSNYLQLVGSRRLSTELGDLAETVNTTGKHGLKFDYSLDADGHQQNIYCRSDHANYARYGIPIIFFTTGGHADYHQVTDEAQYIDYVHMARVDNFIADLAEHVANLDHRPVVDKPKPDPQGQCKQ